MTGIPRGRASAPIWGALLLSAGAWSVHLLAMLFTVEAVCPSVVTAASGAAFDVRAVLLILSLLSAVAAIAGGFYAALRRRSLAGRGPGLERTAGLASVVSALSFFFVLVIVLESVPLLLLGCGAP